MKKTIISILILTLLLCTVGCNNTKGDNIVPSSTPETSSNDEVITSKPNETSKPKPDNTSSSVNTEPSRPEKVIKVYGYKSPFVVGEPVKDVFNDVKNGNRLPYTIYFPNDYTPSKKYPVLLYLHGAGSIGTDNESHLGSVEIMFRYNADFMSQAIVICPQSPEWWNLDRETNGDQKGTLGSVLHLLEAIQNSYSCDSNRIYVTGLSMGGYATWEILEHYGEVFAAGVPLCGFGNTDNGTAFKNIPIRIYHGTADPTVSFSSSQQMYSSIILAGGTKAELYPIEGAGHDIWGYVYNDRDLFSWMFSQNKKSNPTAKYNYVNYFSIVDAKGNTIISDKDITFTDYSIDRQNKNSVDINIYLTDDGIKKLNKSYSASAGGRFTVYCLEQMIYTFTATKPIPDDCFAVSGIFNEDNYFEFMETVRKCLN